MSSASFFSPYDALTSSLQCFSAYAFASSAFIPFIMSTIALIASFLVFIFMAGASGSSPCSPSSISFSSSSSSSSSECSASLSFWGAWSPFVAVGIVVSCLVFLAASGPFFSSPLTTGAPRSSTSPSTLEPFSGATAPFLGASCIPSSSSAATSASKSSIVLSSSDIWEFSLMLISLYYIYTITVF